MQLIQQGFLLLRDLNCSFFSKFYAIDPARFLLLRDLNCSFPFFMQLIHQYFLLRDLNCSFPFFYAIDPARFFVVA